MEQKLKEIRVQLRRLMNGVVVQSMREQGIVYKFNFGVPLPDIKALASTLEKDEAFAKRLWHEDVRELKILATLLYPHEKFSKETADLWIREITHQEIAEQLCINILRYLPFANELASSWICQKEELIQITGFLLQSRLFKAGHTITDEQSEVLLKNAKLILDEGVSRRQRAAISALKSSGRNNKSQANITLEYLKDYKNHDSKEKQEFYNDLVFEFDFFGE
jgi:Predicted DNA alkylation repair enzyme